MVVIRAVQPSQTSWSLITYNWFNGQGPLVSFYRKKITENIIKGSLAL